jgi:hypothetical protein
MIDTKYSKITARRIAVPADNFSFPPECLLCGASPATPIPIEFKRILILFVIAGGETRTLAIPLCRKHASTYQQRQKISNILMTGSFVAGFGGPLIAMAAIELLKLKINIPPVLGLIPIGFIILSFIVLMMKRWNFPVKLKHAGWIIRDDSRLVFTFPNDNVMHRFIRANAVDDSSGEHSNVQTNDAFGHLG